MKFSDLSISKLFLSDLFGNPVGTRVPSLLFITLMLALLPMQSKAQQPGVKVGDRVRLDVPSIQKRPLVGFLGEINNHGVVLNSSDSTYFIPHSSVHKLSVSTGKKRNIAKGAFIGLLGGAALGGIIGILSYEECTEVGLFACFLAPENEGQAFTFGAALGIVPGTLIGVAIGSAKTDRWERVPTRMLLQVKPVGSLQPGIEPRLTFKWSIGSKK